VVLIIDDQEWSTRSLESILQPNGVAVMRAYTARMGLERAFAHVPDAIFIDISLPDGNGIEVCQTLRENPEIGAATPIFVTSPERPTRQQRLDSFRAGAWDVVGYPIDAEELVLRFESFMQSRYAAERLREGGLIDEATGLYNVKGLERRAKEEGSLAYRKGEALACVVMAPRDQVSDDAHANELARSMADVLRQVGRISDVIGRLGKTEFAIIAPATNFDGALGLANRIRAAVRESFADGATSALDLRAGYDAVDDARKTPAYSEELLRRATIALRKSRFNGATEWIQPFEPRN
jgi:diguanylate cyclase (GGDEF)-like protein